MNSIFIIGLVEVLAGLFINLYIGFLAKAILRKDGTAPRIPLRVIGIYLIINGISKLTH
ncbi:hypothetical protein QJQ58_09150 [Paenibacillus dendritiformis]|uniref:hypothetical protein n=1 Tax=Paenibacillus dendritiformis TaxID=130049 RepID=UPI0014095E78|nr:hypothetical protein [Paenibacillus dendritiformis]WGU96379.1 hypothetical protein QJQ58_09150 [Paenibacillus dendritiformis]